jgi:protein ImuB
MINLIESDIARPDEAENQRRIASLWLPNFSINTFVHVNDFKSKSLFVLVQNEGGRNWIAAADRNAQAAGITPGQALADARALYPGLVAHEADPNRDRRALERLADWCTRYTPWVGRDANLGPGEAGLFLEITGCAHLRGGEAGLLADLERHLDRFGLEHRLAIAATPGAAWAWSRFRPAGAGPILAAGAAALLPLPVEALRLPAATAAVLNRLGLKRIGDLLGLPRPALAARLGDALLMRLDQALGRVGEPITPRRPPTSYAVRRDFAEPLLVPEALGAVLDRLLPRLCRLLERDGRGARKLAYTLYRIDGSVAAAAIGTSQPARDPAHLAALFAPRLETLDPDPGIETLILEATETAPFTADQRELLVDSPDYLLVENPLVEHQTADPALTALIDRLANRLGPDRIGFLAPVALPLPERQSCFTPAFAAASAATASWKDWPPATAPLPLRLFPKPEAVEVETPGPCPEEPPAAFLWRGRICRTARASGPDRRLGAWWLGEDAARDYWVVDDAGGRRLWLFRNLAYGRWFVHGVLAPAAMTVS